MRVVSFNVNSIRSRLHQLDAIVEKYSPDFIGIQETKVVDEDFPIEHIHQHGYEMVFTGQKTHYGVALLSQHAFKASHLCFVTDDENAQKRFVSGEFSVNGHTITVINGYFPQGESRAHAVKFPNKEKFYKDICSHINSLHNKTNLIVMGDMNISPEDCDIGIGEDNRKRWLKTGKCSFLPEEREWFQNLLNLGLYDTYRKIYPDKDDVFSWFDYRSRGFERDPKRGLRIDFVLCSADLLEHCIAAGIDYDIRSMERSSDHCPVWAEFDLR